MIQSSELRDTMTKPAIFFFCNVILRLQVLISARPNMHSSSDSVLCLVLPLTLNFVSLFWVNVEPLLFTKYLLILYDIEF